jgi:hypothetical protein
MTDIFSVPDTLIDFSSDVKEISFGGSSKLKNLGGNRSEAAQTTNSVSASKPASKRSNRLLQKNKKAEKQVLWQKMVRKAVAKKTEEKKVVQKKSKKPSVRGKPITNKNRSNRSSNLTPVLGARPIGGSKIPLRQSSFR